MVLSSRSTVPSRVTPDTLRAGLIPATVAATPVERNRNSACATFTPTIGLSADPPSPKERFEAWTSRAAPPSGAVALEIMKSACMPRPARSRLTSSPVTRKYPSRFSPASSTRSLAVFPRLIVSFTALPVVLISTCNAPLTEAPLTPSETVPLRIPAIPFPVMRKAPLPSPSVNNPSARSSLTPEKTMRTTSVSAASPLPPGSPSPPSEVTRSKARFPVSRWPRTSTTTLLPSRRK